MRHTYRNLFIIAVVLGLLGWAIVPPEENLRLGKDLRGGVSLVYSVQIEPGDNAEAVLDQTIEVLKQRVDPDGQLDIAMIARGRDQIEITMPLPSERVTELRDNFERAMLPLEEQNITSDEFDAAVRQDINDFRVMLDSWGWVVGTPNYDAAIEAFTSFGQARASRAIEPQVLEQFGDGSPQHLENIQATVAFEINYENERDNLVLSLADPATVREVLLLSDVPTVKIDSETNEPFEIPGARARAWQEIEERHQGQIAEITVAREAWEAYEIERRTLDDPQDLVRLLRGAGVLTFRISVAPGDHPREGELRNDLLNNGPRAVQSNDTGWYRLNEIESWFNTTAELQALQFNPAGFFLQRGYVVEQYGGVYYMLCWDTRGQRLTPAEGDWSVANAFTGQDRLGKPAINFAMDARGATLLGSLTEAHVGRQMAVLLDDQVYTAPTLQSRIATSGQITGDFTELERRYIINVLNAGSLRARLSAEPISVSTIGPELGEDNKQAGIKAGYWAIGAVSVFMVLYYFTSGIVACLTLVCSAVMILGAMSLNRAAFTLPGIAGVVLTFGMAVDANVLIYERIREELREGKDIRSAVRSGFGKALPSIVDGNVTNLIVCVVLAYFGTQEIRGFAITLGIGVAATLFSALFIARTVFSLFVERIALWKNINSLPRAIPPLGRLLEPKFDWMKLQYVFITISVSLVLAGIVTAASRGKDLFDNEFLGGTQVTLRLSDPETREPVLLERGVVQERVQSLGEGLDEDNPLRELRQAEVLVISPDETGLKSSTFLVKTTATDEQAVLDAVLQEFRDVLSSPPPLMFDGGDASNSADAPIYALINGDLQRDAGLLDNLSDVSAFLGGAATVVANIDPPVPYESILERIDEMTRQRDFRDLGSRTRETLLLEGTADEAVSVVVLTLDPSVSALDQQRFRPEVMEREWELIREALRRAPTPASVQTFSPAIAQSFQIQATTAVIISFLCILIYIWVRFGSVRYSLAAIVTLLHDVVIAIFLIALAEIAYDWNPDLCQKFGILPFRIDLSLVAAMLTIVGYSLNDTIIIMDRIRENRGKLDYASRSVINASINQTLSRTIVTSGTTFIATLILFVFGGEGVRAFSYALLAGIVIGTYSSIAVAAPLVWSSKADRSLGRDKQGSADSGGGQPSPA
ncbi:MAG: protein translocase subunit SecD [Planctomycetota bacterium]